MNGQPTRYHAEIKITVEGREARINIFADTLNEIFLDLAKVAIQFDDLHSQAKREILNAELKSAQLKQEQPQKNGTQKPASTTPVCPNCASTNTELINWTDKVSGELKQAWKCQDCKQWLPTRKR